MVDACNWCLDFIKWLDISCLFTDFLKKILNFWLVYLVKKISNVAYFFTKKLVWCLIFLKNELVYQMMLIDRCLYIILSVIWLFLPIMVPPPGPCWLAIDKYFVSSADCHLQIAILWKINKYNSFYFTVLLLIYIFLKINNGFYLIIYFHTFLMWRL